MGTNGTLDNSSNVPFYFLINFSYLLEGFLNNVENNTNSGTKWSKVVDSEVK